MANIAPHVRRVAAVWRRARGVCFDVDSTVVPEEGIDELAAFLGKREAVERLTRTAMEGGLPYEKALEARLDVMQPSRQDIDAFLKQHPPRLSPYVASVFDSLHRRGVQVFLVSGGFRQLIAPIAREVGLDPEQHVFANTLFFGEDGAFTGFDAKEPTSRTGGKATVVQQLKDRGIDPIVMIGDGATDLEACPPADTFIGYGGVAVRQAVKDGADLFVHSFEEVLALDDVGE